MLIYLLLVISTLLVLSVALEGDVKGTRHSGLPDSSDYAHYWDIHRDRSQNNQ